MECYKCGKNNRLKHSPYCRSCKQVYDRNYYHKNKEKIKKAKNKNAKIRRLTKYLKLREYCLTHPCEDCGESDFVVLDFDHRASIDKFDTVSNMVKNNYSWGKISRELNKCRVLCANCHRRRTAKQLNWYDGV